MNSPIAELRRVAGIRIARIARKELAALVAEHVVVARSSGNSHRPRLIFNANGHAISHYHRSPEFRRHFDQADLVVADGMSLVFISRLFHRSSLPERVCLTDFILDAAQAAQEYDVRFFFLGSTEEDNRAACDFFTTMFPRLQVAGRHHGFFRSEEEALICADVVGRKTDVLWVGMGSPLQERFCVENRERLFGISWIVACGGLFDYYSGRKRRAPQWMQRAGLEWVFRALIEPRRLLLRYMRTNVPALYHLLTKTGRLPGAGDH